MWLSLCITHAPAGAPAGMSAVAADDLLAGSADVAAAAHAEVAASAAAIRSAGGLRTSCIPNPSLTFV